MRHKLLLFLFSMGCIRAQKAAGQDDIYMSAWLPTA